MPILKPYPIYVPPLTYKGVLKHLAIWTTICSIAAAPSFVIALSMGQDFPHIAGMVTGIVIFIIGYTALSCLPLVRRIRRQPFVMPALYVGYGLRILASVIFPVAVIMDMLAGMLTGIVIDAIFPGDQMGSSSDARNYFVIVTWTLLQGAVLNVPIALVLLLTYGIQLITRKMPPPSTANLCRQCGYDLRYSEKNCPECSHPIPVGYGLAMTQRALRESDGVTE